MLSKKEKSIYSEEKNKTDKEIKIIIYCEEDNEFAVAYNSSNLAKLDNINSNTDKFIILDDEENFPLFININSIIGICIGENEE